MYPYDERALSSAAWRYKVWERPVRIVCHCQLANLGRAKFGRFPADPGQLRQTQRPSGVASFRRFPLPLGNWLVLTTQRSEVQNLPPQPRSFIGGLAPGDFVSGRARSVRDCANTGAAYCSTFRESFAARSSAIASESATSSRGPRRRVSARPSTAAAMGETWRGRLARI